MFTCTYLNKEDLQYIIAYTIIQIILSVEVILIVYFILKN